MTAPVLDPWDDVILDGRHAPGICTVKVLGPSRIEVRCVFAWTRENWDYLQEWVDAIWKPGRLTPVSVESPALALLSIRAVLITGITAPATADPPLGLEGIDCEWKMVKLSLVEAAA